MKNILITGSAGHLGSALTIHLKTLNYNVVGIDIKESTHTDKCISILDTDALKEVMKGIDCVIHTATLHKPHIGTHSYSEFLDVNVKGTLNLLEISKNLGVKSFVFTSTTSTFGDSLVPPIGYPSELITERTRIIPKNIYGVTKVAAEDMCRIFF